MNQPHSEFDFVSDAKQPLPNSSGHSPEHPYVAPKAIGGSLTVTQRRRSVFGIFAALLCGPPLLISIQLITFHSFEIFAPWAVWAGMATSIFGASLLVTFLPTSRTMKIGILLVYVPLAAIGVVIFAFTVVGMVYGFWL